MELDDLRGQSLDLIAELNEHVKLLRDYAVTPGNAWLARNELSKVQQLLAELESTIDGIKRAEG